MSKKDFDVYYKKITNQYMEMKKALDQFELDSTQKMVSPEQIENIKKTIQPIKDNYMTMSYVAHLLNIPNRKRKKATYEKQNYNKLSKLDKSKSCDNMIKNCEDILHQIKEKR